MERKKYSLGIVRSSRKGVAPRLSRTQIIGLCSGSTDTLCTMPFRAFNLGDHLNKAVEEAGYTEPTPIQVAAIPKIIAGHDLIGIAQTGTGKTAAFVLPILSSFLSPAVRPTPRHPLVDPCSDPGTRCSDRGKCPDLRQIFAGTDRHGFWRRQRTSADQGTSFRSGLVIATPGRLLDLVGGHGDFSACGFWCWTKPTGCWTWALFPDPAHHEGPSIQTADPVVFRDAFQRDRGAHARVLQRPRWSRLAGVRTRPRR